MKVRTWVRGRTEKESRDLVAAWGELLSRPAWHWSLYATLTFKEPVKESAAERDFTRWLHPLNIERFGRRYRRHGKEIAWVRGTEYQKRGVLHYHALLGNTGELNQYEAMSMWENCGSLIDIDGGLHPRTGFARIYPYDPSRGGVYYVSKYVVKGGWIDLGCGKKTALALKLLPEPGVGLQVDLDFRPGGKPHLQVALPL